MRKSKSIHGANELRRSSAEHRTEHARGESGVQKVRICKKAAGVLTMVILLCMLTGCAARYANMKSDAYDNGMMMGSTQATTMGVAMGSNWDAGWSKEEVYEEVDLESPVSTSPDSAVVNDSARKLIKEASMTVETLEYDIFVDRIEAEIANLGGYIESYTNNNKSYYSGHYSRYASITARIPQQYFELFLNTVGDLGNVISENQNASDVTMSYVDTESRKKALEIEQERLLALLEKADKIEDIIALEQRLSNVRYQLESYASQLRTYDNLVNYSTVRLTIEEVVEITKEAPKTLFERMSKGFSDTISDVVEGAKDFVVWLVTNSIYLVFWVVLLIVIILLVARFFKKMFKKLEKYAKERSEHSKAWNKDAGAEAKQEDTQEKR